MQKHLLLLCPQNFCMIHWFSHVWSQHIFDNFERESNFPMSFKQRTSRDLKSSIVIGQLASILFSYWMKHFVFCLKCLIHPQSAWRFTELYRTRFQKYYMESNTIQLLNFVEGNKIVMFWRSLLLLVEFELWYYFAEWVIQLLPKILEYPWLLLSNVQYKAWYNEFL